MHGYIDAEDEGYTNLGRWNQRKILVYGTKETNLPITSTLIDTDRPCINSNLQRERSGMKTLDIELQEYATCENWSGTEDLMVDESYIEA